jgi:hypothetical protein
MVIVAFSHHAYRVDEPSAVVARQVGDGEDFDVVRDV